MSPASRPDGEDSEMERIDEDENAVTGDTRLRIHEGEHGTYEIVREKYSLTEFESEPMSDDGHSFERYDWFPDEKFVVHSSGQAEQIAGLLAKVGAFSPNITFFRQMDYTEPDAAEQYPDTCPTCGAGSSFVVPVWEDMSDYRFGEAPDHVGCTECGTMVTTGPETEGDNGA